MRKEPIDIDGLLQRLDEWAEEGERYDFARDAAAVIREVRDDAAKFMLENHKLTAQLAEAEARGMRRAMNACLDVAMNTDTAEEHSIATRCADAIDALAERTKP